MQDNHLAAQPYYRTRVKYLQRVDMALLQIAVILTGAFVCVLTDSCSGRCGQGVNAAYSCQCNSACTRYGDCCSDYSAVCLGATCSDRCGQSADMTRPCQCNLPCLTYNDCCDDYQALCVDGISSGGGGSPTDPLSAVMNDIWDSDTNRLTSSEVVINTAGNKLFTSVTEDKFSLPTFQAFINLLNNYERKIGVAEILLENSYQEIETFLDAVLATETMAIANVYLLSNGKVGTSPTAFRDTLKELWFNLYSRSSSQSFDDSSGFEHVMVGELKGSTVSGFHSWIQFYLEEKAGSLTYTSMASQAEPNMKGAAFTWYGGSKSKGSFFLGTSPEFDMALYSICALMYPNARCNFTLKGNSVSVQTWDIGHKPGSQIGSAYPAI
ncbi:uridylate-specific endoribonuclease-like [Mercenaria mercenaria]|uniref:uridylate-specific endoribonuclease-like n=1 Tax=Mercenaria mercenaria TaxID=6596 RepID=UPI001E1DFDB9|nr:uridylate-specific endoribonuclease-like [Mercenaria mercenaria]